MSVPKKRDSARARVNEQITGTEVRLIGKEGEQIGIVSLREAIRMALDDDLDLVEISPSANPPVCRVMDYNKHLFEEGKRQAAAKKKQKVIQVKELKFRPTTEEGDYQVKLRNLIKFLENGDKVKVTVRFRGRELSHQELGIKLLERLQDDVQNFGTVEQHAKREGKQLLMVFGPKKTK